MPSIGIWNCLQCCKPREDHWINIVWDDVSNRGYCMMFFALQASHGLDCTLPRPCHLLPMTNETRKRRWLTWFWERRSFCCCVAVLYCYCCCCPNPALQCELWKVYYTYTTFIYIYLLIQYILVIFRWVGHMLPVESSLLTFLLAFTCSSWSIWCDVLHKQNMWMNSSGSDFLNWWVLTWLCETRWTCGSSSKSRDDPIPHVTELVQCLAPEMRQR